MCCAAAILKQPAHLKTLFKQLFADYSAVLVLRMRG